MTQLLFVNVQKEPTTRQDATMGCLFETNFELLAIKNNLAVLQKKNEIKKKDDIDQVETINSKKKEIETKILKKDTRPQYAS